MAHAVGTLWHLPPVSGTLERVKAGRCVGTRDATTGGVHSTPSAFWIAISLAALGAQGCSGNGEDLASQGAPGPSLATVGPRNDCETVFGADRLSGATNRFGECVGACVSELRFDEQAGCRSLTLHLTGWGRSGQAAEPLVFPQNFGVLTDKGVETGKTVAASLRGKKLLAVYGCPDCADGGATVLNTQSGAVESKVVYEFEHPPDELEKADAFLQPLIDSLATCSSSDLLTIDAARCTPRPRN